MGNAILPKFSNSRNDPKGPFSINCHSLHQNVVVALNKRKIQGVSPSLATRKGTEVHSSAKTHTHTRQNAPPHHERERDEAKLLQVFKEEGVMGGGGGAVI
jgi:hypothetical protein